MTKNGVFRILDANLNRSREGLRVCEDIARFMLNSEFLSRDLKIMRHSITSFVKRMPSAAKVLLESRDTEGDVGRCFMLGAETARLDAADIFAANMQRVKESLRVLEEFAKLDNAGLGIKFQRLRFRAYAVEKKALADLCALRYARARKKARR